jgi:hypothetical protein
MRAATATCGPEHRKFLQHDFQLRIGLHQIEHVGHGAFAVAAIIIEELDKGDVAILVAEGDAARRVEDRFAVFGDARLVLFGFSRGLALAQFGHRLFQHLGMGDQIILDDGLDIAALGVGKTLRRCSRRAAKGEREQCGSEQAERRHWQILCVKAGFEKSCSQPLQISSYMCFPVTFGPGIAKRCLILAFHRRRQNRGAYGPHYPMQRALTQVTSR